MFQISFTRPAAMAVLLLTLTAILAVNSDQKIDEAHYKSLGPGYSYAYLRTPPTEQFFSTRNLFDCTTLSLRSQSEFFTYNKVSHVCKNYSPKNLMTVVSSNDNNEVSFYRNSKWIKTYALSMGAGSIVYNSFANIGSPSTWNVDKCNAIYCPHFFRHPILDFWSHLLIDEVKIEYYRNQRTVVNMTFDGRNTNLKSWFSLKKLKSSPWSDLHGSPINYFSMSEALGRRFYVSSNHGGCEFDNGWIGIVQKSFCTWENFPHLPWIIYSGRNSRVTWNNGYETADSMAIFIRLKS